MSLASFFRAVIALAKASALAAALAAANSALAQGFPSKPVRIYAPQAAGGPNDLLIRLLGNQMKDTLKQTVVVENRPGTGGMVAAEALTKADADGHTMMLVTASLVYSALMMDKPPVNPLKELAPVAMVTFTPLVIAVYNKLPVRSFGELVAYAKANPGKLNAGVSSAGGSDHLLMEMINQRAGIKLTSVVYKGAAPAVQDLIAGRLDLQATTYSFFKPHIDSGALVMIASTNATRNPFTPHIPTIAELGYPGLDIPTWSGFAAPLGTPRAAIATLAAAFKAALDTKDVQEKLAGMSLIPNFENAERFAAVMKADGERVGKVIRESGLKIQ